MLNTSEVEVASVPIMEKIKKLYKEEPKELIFRIISYFLSSLILPNIIFLLFITYMSHNNFFSYDFFTEGIFGMKLFFLMTIVFIFAFSIFLSSWIVLLVCIRKKKCKLSDNKILLSIFPVNIIFFFLMILSACGNIIPWGWFFYIILISIMINIHLSTLIFYNVRHQLSSLCVFIILLFLLTINFSAETSRLISIGLKAFGSGGEIETVITTSNDFSIEGKLLLITPKNIYLKPIDKNGTMIYPISNLSNIYIKK